MFRFEALAVVAEIANEEECKQILRANREAIKFVVSILQCSLKADQHLFNIGIGVQWYAHAIGKGEFLLLFGIVYDIGIYNYFTYEHSHM